MDPSAFLYHIYSIYKNEVCRNFCFNVNERKKQSGKIPTNCILKSNINFQGGDFKNKQTTKQIFEKEYNCSNNCLSSKTIIITIQLFHQEYNCLTKLFLGKNI